MFCYFLNFLDDFIEEINGLPRYARKDGSTVPVFASRRRGNLFCLNCDFNVIYFGYYDCLNQDLKDVKD